MKPLGVEAMVAAADACTAAGHASQEHWQQRIDRSRYEVDLARRQYELVDPANRLVASELERRWEQSLQDLGEVEREASARLKILEKPLTAKDQERLRRYAQNLPELWHSPTVRFQDRKRIVRCLIENVVVTQPDDGVNLEAAVHWVGGEVTQVEVVKGRVGVHCYVADSELLDLIRDLAQEFGDDQIARILICKKLRTPKGLPFTPRRVTGLRFSTGIAGTARARLVGEDIYSAEQAGEMLAVSRCTVIRWVEAGILKGSQLTSYAPWRIRVTAQDVAKLTAQEAPDGWLPLKGAALVIGVSQQTVLQRLKSGELEGVRVQTGRRTSWRINVTATSCKEEKSLF